MPKFCTKCGKSSKPGIKFCTSCGGGVAGPPRADPPPPPPVVVHKGSGCSGCGIGCLGIIVINLLIIAGLLGGGYWFLSRLKKAEPGDYFEVDNPGGVAVECEDSLSCVEKNLTKCVKATGEAVLGEFAEVELEVMGKSGTSCVVFAKIVDIQELPEGMNMVPDFMLDMIMKDLSMECLIPRNVYTKGMEEIGQYIGENMVEVCKGPFFDMADKFGVDLTDM